MEDTLIADTLEANIGGPAICFLSVTGREIEAEIIAVDRRKRLFKYLTESAREQMREAEAKGLPTDLIRKHPLNHRIISFDEVEDLELYY